MRSIRTRALAAALAVSASLALGVAACGTTDPPVLNPGAAGGPPPNDGTEGTAPSEPGTTVGTAPVSTLPAHVSEVATAKGCEIEVVAEKGTGPSGAPSCDGTPPPTQPKVQEPVASGSGVVPGLPAIPRVGLSSAGVRRTPLGWAYTNPTYFDGPLTFLVTARDGDWLKVLVPARPNHTEGWVRAADVTVTTSEYHLQLSLSDYHLVVTRGTEVIADTKVVIGAPGTPTPTGRFYVNDKVAQTNPYGSYGPWVLSTNGYSEALDLFDSGLPVIAFHGTDMPGLIGTQSSNGCIRMPNDVVAKLAAEVPVGTPIDIVA